MSVPLCALRLLGALAAAAIRLANGFELFVVAIGALVVVAVVMAELETAAAVAD